MLLTRSGLVVAAVAVSFLLLISIAHAAIQTARGDAAGNAMQAVAAMQTMCRVLPNGRCRNFNFLIDPSFRGSKNIGGLINTFNEAFLVSATNDTVYVTAASGVGLTAGAYHYLKKATKCQVTWGEDGTGNQLELPDVLPPFPPTMVNSTVPWRYAWNMCTFSYSAAWWDVERWQREIDWMALHGINLPLALTGQEYIWVQVFAKLNVTLDQLQEWFTGPAFLAWQRAGNIRKFAGPLTAHWIDEQQKLQRSIISRMRSLGMTPVLPCFAGHVPEVVKKLFPNAKLTQSASWNNFPPEQTNVWFLDPADELYVTLGQMFMEVLRDDFGTDDHYYSCDTYNEVAPTSTAPEYLKNASASVLKAIQTVDKQGVWVMQGWLFHFPPWNPSTVEWYLSGVPDDKMLILDLNSEEGALAPQFKQYYGKRWIWNLLHNYGGVRGMYGNLSRVATGPFADLHAKNSTMIGIGFTPEAIEQNPVMYELLTDTFWGQQPVDVASWLHDYVVQRYRSDAPQLLQSWAHLVSAVYNQGGEPRSEIEWVPHWQQPNYAWHNGDPTTMLQAWESYLSARASVPNVTHNGPYQYDLVDITRQSAVMFFSDLHRVLVNVAWTSADSIELNSTAILMKSVIAHLDVLLGTNPNYLLGRWTTRAASFAKTATDAALLLYNAKNQITMWGPDAQIDDYAAKAWHDLYGTYYLQRWTIMLDLMVELAATGELISRWNSYTYAQKILEFERAWDTSSTQFSPDPTGDGAAALSLSETLHELVATSANLDGNYSTPVANFAIDEDHVIYVDPMWTTDPRQLAILCDLFPSGCIAFDTQGFLYTATSGSSYSGVTTYIAKRAGIQ